MHRSERWRLLHEVHDCDGKCSNEADGTDSSRDPQRAPIDPLDHAALRHRLEQGHGITDVPQAPLRVLLETALHQHACRAGTRLTSGSSLNTAASVSESSSPPKARAPVSIS